MQNGSLLQKLREEKKLTLSDIADELKVTLKTYSLYEQGLWPMPLEELNHLSNYYKISLNALLGLTNREYYYNTEKKIDYKYLRFSLRYVRRMNRVPIYLLAKEFHMAHNTIIKYEKGLAIPNLNYIYLFCKRFKVSCDYICGKTLKKEV